TATVALLVGRPLPLLHAAPLPFLFLFPLYALYPDLFYPGTPKQVGLPLFAAVCLLPVVAPVGRPGSLLAALGVTGLLAALAAALSPVRAPAVAAAVYASRARPRWRARVAQAAVGLLVLALVLGSAPYSRGLLSGRAHESPPRGPTAESAEPAAPAAPPAPLF